MIQGFKDFIMRGNIIDLAVAVVIGTAFANVVSAVVQSLIQPFINALGGANSTGLGFQLIGSNPATFVNISGVINALIVFLLTALVVYFVFVLPMNKFNDLRTRNNVVVEEEPVAEDIAVLREIRDLLASQRGGSPTI